VKGNDKLLETLNSLLADEMTAINQYIVHAEMCENWGYDRLHDHFEKRAIDEMKHAAKLIGRILFLEGRPVVSELRQIRIGKDVPAQLANDKAAETDAIKAYNDAIGLASQVGDNATKDLLQHILEDEDKHIDQIEERQDQIEHMGLAMFLSIQVGR